MMIYVASSWRNLYQPGVVVFLREQGHDVYDFRNPPGRSGFGWEQIAAGWRDWTPDEYNRALSHPIAQAGFASDFEAMRAADACVLVLPSGRSAHLEAGYFVGAEKPLVTYIPERIEPELMYLMGSYLVTSEIGLLDALAAIRSGTPAAPMSARPLRKGESR